MPTLRDEIKAVITNYLQDWDKESGFDSQASDLTDMILETVDEAPKSIPHNAACFFRDGNMWACVFGDFINLQESPAGFGESFDTALIDLQSNHEKEKRYVSELSSPPT